MHFTKCTNAIGTGIRSGVGTKNQAFGEFDSKAVRHRSIIYTVCFIRVSILSAGSTWNQLLQFIQKRGGGIADFLPATLLHFLPGSIGELHANLARQLFFVAVNKVPVEVI